MALTKEQPKAYRQQSGGYFERAGTLLTPEETANIKIADFDLNEKDY